ncbi:MAG: hypothetical protein IJK19_08480 [Bacteroidales bacterium]|nr:hypothetical protein [Bacteroidales bacterium]
MNIAVLKTSGNYCFRPDNTLNREARDYYLPDGVEAVSLTPCIYAKVVKAGKCIAGRFAGRYVDNFGFGVLLDAASADPMEAVCLDGTSYLSGDTLPVSDIEEAAFEVLVNEEPWYSGGAFSAAMLHDAVVTVSRRSSLRATDLLAVCLPASTILHKGDSFSFAGHKVSIL